MSEAREIQKQLSKSIERDVGKEAREKSKDRLFVKNMMFGKVGAAAKQVNNDDAVKGVHALTE